MSVSITRSSALQTFTLALFFAVLVAVSWQRWGDPVSDAGLDLTTAAGWIDGAVPYRDVRYWYGPLGIGLLAGAFWVFGTSLATAAGFGLLLTVLIAELSRRLALRWVPAPVAAAAAGCCLAVGFSGSMFNFQLPHTFAAPLGVATLLAALLALSHRRFGWAGIAIGLSALTRPEFLAFTLVALGGAALGLWRERAARDAVRGVLRAGIAAVVVAAPVLGWFMAQAGAYEVVFENIFPLDFLRTAGASFEELLQPRDAASIGAVIARGAFAGAALAAAVAVLAAALGPARRRAPAPREIKVAAASIAAALLAATLLGVAGGEPTQPLRAAASDTARLLIAMSALPALAAVVFVFAARAWWRRERPPLGLAGRLGSSGPGWTGAGALVAVCAACGLRAYGLFTTDLYATYYAPPVLVLGAVTAYAATARLGARNALGAAAIMVAAAATLSTHAVVAKYPNRSVLVQTPRGSFHAEPESAGPIQQVIDTALPQLRGDRRILAMPQEPGFAFLTRSQPALHDSTFLPGVLVDAHADGAAAAELLADPPPVVVVSNRNLETWGFERSGVDVNVQLQRAVENAYGAPRRFGDTSRMPPATERADAFSVYLLRLAAVLCRRELLRG